MTMQMSFSECSRCPEWVGSVGVAILLDAFFLNLFGWLRSESRIYQALNALGAGVACYASYLIGFIPFVILEGVWSVVATVAFVRDRQL